MRLDPLGRDQQPRSPRPSLKDVTVAQRPYRFARTSVLGGYLDLTRDGDAERLARFGLPNFQTPEDLASWLGIKLGRLAWLTHRCDNDRRPVDVKSSHYHHHWIRKRSGGWRLIEAPKPHLRAAQQQILDEILDRIPSHPAAQGFVVGRSIKTNAAVHVGQRVVLRFDLQDFYPSVTFARVVAIFRSLGYNREVAIWLGALTTSALPLQIAPPEGDWSAVQPYARRHLPQGACTSPTLANLSAFSLDLRLAGLARKFGANYTRYADDLTFSGPDKFLGGLWKVIPLIEQIVQRSRFRLHRGKRKVMRDSQQQRVTGVIVNTRVNVARREFDKLKAILVNCLRRGPSTQNHEQHPAFAAHLLGRIAHIAHLNPVRGEKLTAIYRQIDWTA